MHCFCLVILNSAAATQAATFVGVFFFVGIYIMLVSLMLSTTGGKPWSSNSGRCVASVASAASLLSLSSVILFSLFFCFFLVDAPPGWVRRSARPSCGFAPADDG